MQDFPKLYEHSLAISYTVNMPHVVFVARTPLMLGFPTERSLWIYKGYMKPPENIRHCMGLDRNIMKHIISFMSKPPESVLNNVIII